MTVLTAIQRAAVVIGIDKPVAVFGQSGREYDELIALSIELQSRIAKERDWNALKETVTMTGDGAVDAFSLPADYSRMLEEGQLWSSLRKDKPLTHVTDSDIWLSDMLSGASLDNPQWTIYGGQLHIMPAPSLGEVVKYWYIKKTPEFSADADVFVLDERVLTLGIIWQWKSNKGLPYAEDMANYEIALDDAIGDDRGADILSVGSGRTRAHDDYVVPVDLMP